MNLVYFTKDAYKLLKKDLDSNKEKYKTSEPWLEGYFSEQNISEYYKTSSIAVPEVSLVYSGSEDEQKCKDDLANVMVLYGAYKDKITPLQASDPLLWSALCHLVPGFKQYILKRWSKDDGEVSINKRFFATEGRTSLCYYNAISRLWWSGYLTYDEEMKNSDPWHLTKILFTAQQIQKDLFDTPLSMNRNITKGALLALEQIQKDTGNINTTLFRECVYFYLNRYGCVTILDSLSAEEIQKIIYNYMLSRLSSSKS